MWQLKAFGSALVVVAILSSFLGWFVWLIGLGAAVAYAGFLVREWLKARK